MIPACLKKRMALIILVQKAQYISSYHYGDSPQPATYSTLESKEVFRCARELSEDYRRPKSGLLVPLDPCLC
jgi:hypothetical protein